MKNIEEDAVSNSGESSTPAVKSVSRNVLFVILPNEEVATLKHLEEVFNTYIIKSRLELMCGLPAQMFTLYMPTGQDLSEEKDLIFGQDIQTGTVLRARVFTSWAVLYSAVCRNDVEELVNNGGVRMADQAAFRMKDARDLHNMLSERAFVALFMASHKGLLRMCSTLLTLGANLYGQTPFGRTAIHAAASQDNLHVVQTLVKFGADNRIVDFQSKSPLDVAVQFGACTCETWLRLNSVNLCGRLGSGGQTGMGKKSHRKVRPHHDSSHPKRPQSSVLRESQTPGHVYFAAESDSIQMIAKNSAVTKKTDYEYPRNECFMCSSEHAARSVGDISVRPLSSRVCHANYDKTAVLKANDNNYVPSVANNKTHSFSEQDTPTKGKIASIEAQVSSSDENNFESNSNGLTVPPTTPRESTHNIETAYGGLENGVERSEQIEVNVASMLQANETTEPVLNDREFSKENMSKSPVSSHTVPRRASSARYPSVRYTSAARIRLENSRRPKTALPQSKTINSWIEGRTRDVKDSLDKEERMRQNKAAFELWLKRKRREENNDDGDDASAVSSPRDRERIAANERAYNKWLDKKDEYFENLREIKKNAAKGEKSVIDNSKRMTIFQLENTDPTPAPQQSPRDYASAFHNWLRSRKPNGSSKKDTRRVSSAPLEEMRRRYEERRRAMLTEAVTYEEWLDLKSEADSLMSRESESDRKRRPKSAAVSHDRKNDQIINVMTVSQPRDEHVSEHSTGKRTPRIYSYQNWTYNKKQKDGVLPKNNTHPKRNQIILTQNPLVISQYVYPAQTGGRTFTPRTMP